MENRGQWKGQQLPGIKPMTPGLCSQCSATELWYWTTTSSHNPSYNCTVKVIVKCSSHYIHLKTSKFCAARVQTISSRVVVVLAPLCSFPFCPGFMTVVLSCQSVHDGVRCCYSVESGCFYSMVLQHVWACTSVNSLLHSSVSILYIYWQFHMNELKRLPDKNACSTY